MAIITFFLKDSCAMFGFRNHQILKSTFSFQFSVISVCRCVLYDTESKVLLHSVYFLSTFSNLAIIIQMCGRGKVLSGRILLAAD